jgi:hypothetical protein
MAAVRRAEVRVAVAIPGAVITVATVVTMEADTEGMMVAAAAMVVAEGTAAVVDMDVGDTGAAAAVEAATRIASCTLDNGGSHPAFCRSHPPSTFSSPRGLSTTITFRMRFPLLCLLVVFLLGRANGADRFFKKDDVIAFVGGEDMVVSSEDGFLETLLTRALPDYHLRFRNLAWEGDTVYAQFRDLNFPSWEEQLDKIGATVVVCQFGQMESLDGKDKLPEFIDAYQKLLGRFRGTKNRRIIIITPTPFSNNGGPAGLDLAAKRNPTLDLYREAICELAVKQADARLDDFRPPPQIRVPFDLLQTRDGVHLSSAGQWEAAQVFLDRLEIPHSLAGLGWRINDGGTLFPSSVEDLRQFIVAKNKLWFNYWRPQNWAFLFGDRTNQPSSRDWRDPSKRWFPAEREEFVPLIEAKEKEIDALAEKLK